MHGLNFICCDVSCQSPQLLHKYLAAYAASLIKDNKVNDALALYVQHGAPAAKSVWTVFTAYIICFYLGVVQA